MPKISIDFVSEKLRDELLALRSGKHHEQQLYKLIVRAFQDIACDVSCSIKIPRKLWPKKYNQYGITNLWKYDLPNGWRLLFSIRQDDILVVAMVLEWLSHKDYERRFKY